HKARGDRIGDTRNERRNERDQPGIRREGEGKSLPELVEGAHAEPENAGQDQKARRRKRGSQQDGDRDRRNGTQDHRPFTPRALPAQSAVRLALIPDRSSGDWPMTTSAVSRGSPACQGRSNQLVSRGPTACTASR